MRALPFAFAFVLAFAFAPTLARSLARGGRERANYRGRPLPFPFGVLTLVVAPLTLAVLVPAQQLSSTQLLSPALPAIATYALGVLVLGLLDDELADETRDEHGRVRARGLRGHSAAVLRGEPSTGALKATGTLGLALLVSGEPAFGLPRAHWLLSAAVLVLAANAFNLLDLRPGRTGKAFAALAAALTAIAGSPRVLWALGPLLAPALVAGAYDLRERVLLGDTGSNLLGALAGLWLVLTLSRTGALIALALLAGITLYGEFRSISALIERAPLLRRLDSWGRPS
jgi:UDP-GlcNAc:undecaprenyl-phosphate/decaprenyl-phosphate GlcNAc-1-phosphate transferase